MSEAPSPPVLGIDLGTTNCVVAAVLAGQVVLLRDELSQFRVPSVVTLGQADKTWIGTQAVAIGATVPEAMAYAVKRLIGRRYTDPVVGKAREVYPYRILESDTDGGVAIQLGEAKYAPEEISSMVLRELKDMAAAQFGFAPHQAVITVPAYFNHAQREATQRAAERAGLSVLRLLNEPTAAALSLHISSESERVMAIYDIGGGTFDISVIRIQGRVYEVLSTDGDTFLGGDDIDTLLCEQLAGEFEKSTGIRVRSFPLAWHRLRDATERAKIELNHAAQCSVFLPRLVGEKSLVAQLTTADLEEKIHPLIDRTLEICRQALSNANRKIEDLSDLIFVGGPTRMPLIRSKVEAFFGRKASTQVNPDTAVAEGAAKEGAMLQQGEGVLLLDVTPMTLGINILGNRMYPLIHRNSKIPVSKEHVFTTYRERQKRARIAILQGDSPVATDNTQLGELILSGLRGAEQFSTKLNVVFEIDANGILHVKARDVATGKAQDLTIRESTLAERQEQTAAEGEGVFPSAEGNSPPTAFSGPFHLAELVDVLTFLHANRKNGRLEIRSDDKHGQIILNDGEITHAAFEGATGAAVVRELLSLDKGRYAFYEGACWDEPAEIEIPFEDLVLV